MNNAAGVSCEICGEDSSPLETCIICGAQVCSRCIDHTERACLNCMETRCQICGEYLASRACNTCGTLVCEDHGVKLGESTICDNCRKSEV